MSIAARCVGLLAASAAMSVAIVSAPGAVTPAHATSDPAPRAAAAVPTIPTWTGSVTAAQNGKQYRYRMVGQDPRVKSTNPTTTIVAIIIPVVVKLSDGSTFDPTTKSCGETASPLNAVLASPVFQNTVFSPGGTTVGNTQYVDAYQRANFWAYTNPSGINPGYHVLLKPKVGKTITVKVPTTDGRVDTRHSCKAAEVTMAYAVTQGLKLLPTLAAKPWGVRPSTFPIFLLRNVEFDKALGVSGSVGFHTAVPNPAFHGASQTVAVASYLDAAVNPREPDISVLSHEIGEWMDDPLGSNPTPPWGSTGQVNGDCQSTLENGDPLTRTTFAVTRNGVTYHPQELAFFSWFYGPTPSIGVNGSFSFNATFTHPAPRCPPGGP